MIVRGNPHPFGFKPFGNFDPTLYTFFGTAGFAGNTAVQWQDESGKGHHLTNADADDRFVLTTDAQNKPVYRSSPDTGGVFSLPNLSPTASDYTIYVVLRPAEVGNVYLLDANAHSLALGLNLSELGAYYYAGAPRGSVSVAVGELALLVWRLQASVGGRVYKNGQLVYTGPYAPSPLNPIATLGHDFSTYYAPFNGDLHAFALRRGNDTDAQVAETSAYLAGLAGLSL